MDQVCEAARRGFHGEHTVEQLLPADRGEFFAWLFEIAFRQHLVNLVATVVSRVRMDVAALCRKLGVEPDEAVQVGWIRAQRAIENRGEESLHSYTPEDAWRWFWRITSNAARDLRRSGDRRKMPSLSIEPSVPDCAHDEVDALRRCVGKLPDEERRVIEFVLEGRKPTAIAEEIGQPVRDVYYLIRRAKTRLRLCLEGDVLKEKPL
jgi:RNA polymerase sigma factor (sigma-70 family)